MRKQTAGFTLIELVVVIVILGILAAVAVPKFINLSSDARVAVMKSVEGTMRSANGILYAKAATAGQDSAATGSVTINGTAVATAYGYAKDTTNLALIMDLDSNIAPGVCGTANCFYHKGAASGTTGCFVSYAAPTGPGLPPTYTPASPWACD